MLRKSLACLLTTALLSIAPFVSAQHPGKIPRIGYVSGTGVSNSPGPQVEAFLQGLRDLGYVEGKNILVEYRYSLDGRDSVSNLTTELVRLKVDVLVVPTTLAIRAAKNATKTIPIVMVSPIDPVAAGFVASLARPVGNITGLA